MFSGLQIVSPPTAEPVTVTDLRTHARISITVDDSLLLGYLSAARQICELQTRRAFLTQTWRLALRHWPGRDPTGHWKQHSGLAEYAKFNAFKVPLPPLQSVVSFTYTDSSGNVNSMTEGYGNQVGNYLLDLNPEPGEIRLPFSGIWPTTILLPGSPILLTFKAGYLPLAGTVTLDGTAVTWASGDKFTSIPPSSWITVGGISLVVMSVADDTHLTLFAPAADAGTDPLPYTANTVPMSLRQAILLLAAHFYENREPIAIGRITQIATQIPFTVDALLSPYRVFGATNEETAA